MNKKSGADASRTTMQRGAAKARATASAKRRPRRSAARDYTPKRREMSNPVNRIADLDGDGKVGLSDATTALQRLINAMSKTTNAAGEATRKVAETVANGAKKSAAIGRKALVKGSDTAANAGRKAGKAASDAGRAAAHGAGVVGTSLLDLNNDGKIDDEDLRIATERAISVAKETADGLASSDTVKGAGKAAIIVATIAIPVPLIGPAGGAALGAGGYLTVKAVREIAEAIGTAIGGGMRRTGARKATKRVQSARK